MLFWMIVKVAFKSLMANKMRSILAMLGIIIGVAAVIAMLAIGTGAKQQVLDRISAMGTNLLIARPSQRGTAGVISGTQLNLTDDDAKAILAKIDDVQSVAPVVGRNFQVKYRNQNTNTPQALGTTASYLGIRDFEIDRGRMFNDFDIEHWNRVAVLGPLTASNLFGFSDPIGETIKINGINFTEIIVPYSVDMHVLMGVNYLREIDIQCEPGADLDAVQSDIVALMRQRHKVQPSEPDDVQIQNQAQFVEAFSQTASTFTILLGTVGGMSLLVGGIGIMNIMLVTVTERTREIGIRKAIGAREFDILSQFLIEAMLMSGVGGLTGMGFGLAVSWLVGMFSPFPTQVRFYTIVMSLAFSAGVGVFFGFYPATRAAKLDPIEALRYE
jgi:putative ABC transport system permease protein